MTTAAELTIALTELGYKVVSNRIWNWRNEATGFVLYGETLRLYPMDAHIAVFGERASATEYACALTLRLGGLKLGTAPNEVTLFNDDAQVSFFKWK